MVAVVSQSGKPLMPTSEYRARRLLKSGKAEICNYRPFAIRLLHPTTEGTQEIEYCMDTGYLHIGNSVKSEKHEYLALQVDTLKDERSKHDACRVYRRTRRNRLRYRKPRFDNRKTPDGWIPPSLQHKVDIHLSWLQKICRYIPVKRIVLEMGQFDIQVLKAVADGKPLPQGTDYQHGERYGIDTLREAVFMRDHHTCLCCGRSIKNGAILHAHHIQFRSMGGTNAMSNLATVCEKCHTQENHKPGGKLYGWKPKLPTFKGEAYMNTVRWILHDRVKASFPDKEVRITYGAETKRTRLGRNMEKSHINYAYCMGEFRPRHRSRPIHLGKKRRNNRILEKFYDARYVDSRDGKLKSGQQLTNGRINRNHKKDGENLHPCRREKTSKGRRNIRRRHYGIQTGDMILFQGKLYAAKGCQHYGTWVALGNGTSVSIKKLRVKSYAGGYVST